MSPRAAATQPTATQQAAHTELHPEISFDHCGLQSRAAGAPARTRGGGEGTNDCIQQATAAAPPEQCSTTSVFTEYDV